MYEMGLIGRSEFEKQRDLLLAGELTLAPAEETILSEREEGANPRPEPQEEFEPG